MKFRLLAAEGYAELGMHEEARRELKEVPRTQRSSRLFLETAMEIYRQARDWEKCREFAAQLVTVDPMNVQGYITNAYATRRQVGLQEAAAILLQAQKLHPGEAIIHFNLGCYAAQLGEHEKAVRLVKRAIKLDQSYLEIAAKDPDLDDVREKIIVDLIRDGSDFP